LPVRKEALMKLSDLHTGDYVTCLRPVGVYSSREAFTPQEVGTIACSDAGLPAPVIVDFYSRRIPFESPHRRVELWRTCLRLDNVKRIPQEQAHHYLQIHAPTWEEHLQELLSSYGDSYYEAVGTGICQPYPMYPAHAVLVPFLQTRPSQQELLAFLETFRPAFAWTGNRVQAQASTLVVANKFLHETRIPWSYVTTPVAPSL
jgi:hypothetical protein